MGTDQAVAARVVEAMPNGIFRVELENRNLVLAHPSAEQVKNFVRLLPGDRVEVEFAEHDPTRARIIKKIV